MPRKAVIELVIENTSLSLSFSVPIVGQEIRSDGGRWRRRSGGRTWMKWCQMVVEGLLRVPLTASVNWLMPEPYVSLCGQTWAKRRDTKATRHVGERRPRGWSRTKAPTCKNLGQRAKKYECAAQALLIERYRERMMQMSYTYDSNELITPTENARL